MDVDVPNAMKLNRAPRPLFLNYDTIKSNTVVSDNRVILLVPRRGRGWWVI